MPVLNPSPEYYGQAIRLKLQALSENSVVIVSESSADARTIAKFLADNVSFTAAKGKANTLGAYSYLTDAEHRRVLFIVDCDGEDNSRYLNLPNLIISENRDLESDYFLSLGAFKELVVQALMKNEEYEDIELARKRSTEINSFVLTLAEAIGRVRAHAVRSGMKVKVMGDNGRPRKVDSRELPEIVERCSNLGRYSYEEVAESFAMSLSWPADWKGKLLQREKLGATKPCRFHRRKDCFDCRVRQFANGHDLVQIAGRVYSTCALSNSVDDVVNYSFFEELLRAAGSNNAGSWSTIERSARFEKWSNRRVLRFKNHNNIPTISGPLSVLEDEPRQRINTDC